MTEILITEGFQDPTTCYRDHESDQSIWEITYPNDWGWQDLPDYIASRPPSLDPTSRFLEANQSFDTIAISHYTGSLAFVVSSDEIAGQFHTEGHFLTTGDVYNTVRNLHAKQAEQIHCPTPEISTAPPAAWGMHRFSFADTSEIPGYMEDPLLYSVREFALGLGGIQPYDTVVEMAERVVRAVHDFTIGPCITVDDEGGELDLQLRLNNGLLVMANLFPDGTIDASVYDDSQGIPVKTVKRMRRSTTSERELIGLFRAGIHASTTC